MRGAMLDGMRDALPGAMSDGCPPPSPKSLTETPISSVTPGHTHSAK